MEVSVQELIQRAKRKRLLDKSESKTKLGMMRHFFILLDMSQNMKTQASIKNFILLLQVVVLSR